MYIVHVKAATEWGKNTILHMSRICPTFYFSIQLTNLSKYSHTFPKVLPMPNPEGGGGGWRQEKQHTSS